MKLSVVCCGLMVFGLTSAQNITPKAESTKGQTQDQTEERRQLWQAALQKAFKGYSSAVVVDVNLDADIPFTAYSARLSEAKFANLFALQVGRVAVSQSTGWVIVRQAGSSSSRYDAGIDVARWLSKVPDEELSRLCNSAIPFHDLSEDTMKLLARHCSNPGLQAKMANGEFAAASVRFQIMLTFKDKEGVVQTYPADPFSKDSEKMEKIRSQVESTYKQPQIVVEPKKTLTGKLDFSEGQVLRLDELVAKAAKALGKYYVYDGRLSRSYFYIQGKYNDQTFLEYLKAVLKTIEPAEISFNPDEVSAILTQALKNKISVITESADLPS